MTFSTPAEPSIAEALAKFSDRLEAIEAKLTAYDADADADYDADDDEGESDGEEKAKPGKGKKAGDDMKGKPKKVPIVSASANLLAEVEGRFAAKLAEVTKRIQSLQDETSGASLFSALVKDLKDVGIPNLEKELKIRVKDGTAVAWAAGIKQAAKPARVETSPEAKDAPDVAAYADQGPEVLAEARRLAQMFQALPKSHFLRPRGLKSFLATQIEVKE